MLPIRLRRIDSGNSPKLSMLNLWGSSRWHYFLTDAVGCLLIELQAQTHKHLTLNHNVHTILYKNGFDRKVFGQDRCGSSIGRSRINRKGEAVTRFGISRQHNSDGKWSDYSMVPWGILMGRPNRSIPISAVKTLIGSSEYFTSLRLSCKLMRATSNFVGNTREITRGKIIAYLDLGTC
jgi:hypothetical protein